MEKYKKEYAILKFNNGAGAVLCSNCRIIIRAGNEMTEEDWQAVRGEIKLEAQYCDSCAKT